MVLNQTLCHEIAINNINSTIIYYNADISKEFAPPNKDDSTVEVIDGRAWSLAKANPF